MSSRQSTKAPLPKGKNQKAKQAARQAALANSQLQATQEVRRQTQTERQRQAVEAVRRRQRMIKIRTTAIVVGIIVVLGGGLLYMYLSDKAVRDVAEARARDFAANPPGELVPQQLSPHIATVDTLHDPYTTDPPTSGPHVKEVPAWKVHAQQLRKELQVHALEDAGVVINYQPDLDKTTVDRLAALTESYSKFAQDDKDHYDNHVLMSPYTGLDHPIVLTAWRRIARLDSFDEVRIKRFIEAYKNIDHHKDSGS